MQAAILSGLLSICSYKFFFLFAANDSMKLMLGSYSCVHWHNHSLPMGQEPLVGQGLLIIEASRSHSVIHTTLGRTPLDEWSARSRDFYLTTHNTHKRRTSKFSDIILIENFVKNPLFDLTVRMERELTHAVSIVALQCSISVQDRKVRQRLVFMGNANRSSVVGIRGGRSAVRIAGGARGFSLLRNIQTGFGAPPSLLLNCYWDSFLGRQAAGIEPLSSTWFRA